MLGHMLGIARAGWVVAAFAILGETPAMAQLAFDVASIKPSAAARAGGEASGRERVSWAPNSLTLQNAGLGFCIQWAYNVKFYQVSGPAWLTDLRFDILAKSENPATLPQLKLMLQRLLAERFQLTLHRENKTLPVYELIARKGETNLHAAKPDETSDWRISGGSFVFRHTSMQEFAARLSDLAGMDRPVVDKTGITGVFDFTLESAARRLLEDSSSIFAAVQEIGFEMVARKGPVEMLVVDHAEKPSAN